MRAVRAVGGAVGSAVAWLVAAVVVVIPWAFQRMLRRNPLRDRPG